jgi:FkbM family methyltransferase
MQPLLQSGDVRVKQCRYGHMAYLTTDQYIGRALDLYGEYSEFEIDLFRQILRPGATAVEVGANLGAHTVFLGQATAPGGTVHAFEPQRIIFQLLCANVALNGLTNVHTHQSAVGRAPGTIVVPRLDYSRVNNFGGLSLAEAGDGELVPLSTLDSLHLPECHLLKIDVEGMEGEVIAGAEALIRRCRPALYVENDRLVKSPALIRQLFGLDYRLYWHLPPMFNPRNYWGVGENIFGNMVSINMLGLPRSIPQQVVDMREITSPDENWQRGLMIHTSK